MAVRRHLIGCNGRAAGGCVGLIIGMGVGIQAVAVGPYAVLVAVEPMTMSRDA